MALCPTRSDESSGASIIAQSPNHPTIWSHDVNNSDMPSDGEKPTSGNLPWQIWKWWTSSPETSRSWSFVWRFSAKNKRIHGWKDRQGPDSRHVRVFCWLSLPPGRSLCDSSLAACCAVALWTHGLHREKDPTGAQLAGKFWMWIL